MENYCKSCGADQDSNALFCSVCGKPMDNRAAQEAVAESTVTEEAAVTGAERFDNIPPVPPYNAGDGMIPPSQQANAMNGGGYVPPYQPTNTMNDGGFIPPVQQPNTMDGSGYVPPYQQYGQNGYNNYTPQQQPQQQSPTRGKDIVALIGMIVGISSAVFMCLNYLDIPVAIAGIVLSIIGLKSLRRKGMAVAGLICSVVGLIGSIIWLIVGIYALDTMSDAIYDNGGDAGGFYEEFYEDFYEDFDYDDYNYEYNYDW